MESNTTLLVKLARKVMSLLDIQLLMGVSRAKEMLGRSSALREV